MSKQIKTTGEDNTIFTHKLFITGKYNIEHHNPSSRPQSIVVIGNYV